MDIRKNPFLPLFLYMKAAYTLGLWTGGEIRSIPEPRAPVPISPVHLSE